MLEDICAAAAAWWDLYLYDNGTWDCKFEMGGVMLRWAAAAAAAAAGGGVTV